jgi:hypothetical protein
VERLARALAALPPTAGAAALLERVAVESDARPDDMAACVLAIEGPPAEARVLREELELDRVQDAGERTERFLLACGVESYEIPELVRAAHLATGRENSVRLELDLRDGASPKVALRRESAALPRAPQVPYALRRTGLGVPS